MLPVGVSSHESWRDLFSSLGFFPMACINTMAYHVCGIMNGSDGYSATNGSVAYISLCWFGLHGWPIRIGLAIEWLKVWREHNYCHFVSQLNFFGINSAFKLWPKSNYFCYCLVCNVSEYKYKGQALLRRHCHIILKQPQACLRTSTSMCECLQNVVIDIAARVNRSTSNQWERVFSKH